MATLKMIKLGFFLLIMQLSIKLIKTKNTKLCNTSINHIFLYLELVLISLYILMLTIEKKIGLLLGILMKCLQIWFIIQKNLNPILQGHTNLKLSS
jgi:hypothetical protein